MKKYILIFEAGSNDVCGKKHWIQKKSWVIEADSSDEAFRKHKEMKYTDILIFGHLPDYQCLIDIKEIPN